MNVNLNGATVSGYESGVLDSAISTSATGSLPIELPLLQSHGSVGSVPMPLVSAGSAAATGFYSYSGPAGYGDPGTPSTASSTYSSLLPTYNPYSTIAPNFEFIFNSPWPFVDIGDVTPLTDPSGNHATTPFLAQTISPLQPGPMTRYATRSVNTTHTAPVQNPRRGGRRPREEYERTDLTEEDKDKRDKRRLRNKEAAARCRQRRLDLMGSLQQQKEGLQAQNDVLANRYNALRKGMEELLQFLRTHDCQMRDELQRQLDVYANALNQHQFMTTSTTAAGTTAMGDVVPQSSSGPQQMQQQHSLQQPPQVVHQLHQHVNQAQSLPPVSVVNGKRRSLRHDEGGNSNPLRPTTLPLAGIPMKEDSLSLISPTSSYDDTLNFFDSPGVKRSKFDEDSPIERPSTLSLNWGQAPSIVTPSSGMPQIADFVKNVFPEEYGVLSHSTFLTPSVPIPVSVTTSGPLPPPSDDLQTL